MRKKRFTRRRWIQHSGQLAGAGVLVGAGTQSAPSFQSEAPSPSREAIASLVQNTAFVDTHEHLIEERFRVSGKHRRIQSNDWSILLSHYLDSDLRVSGMPHSDFESFFKPGLEPMEKWRLLEPYWRHVKLTGYGQAVELAVRRLYGVTGLSAETVSEIQRGYESTVKPGFYRKILGELAHLESCQVNSLEEPFTESADPQLLMQDLSILGMHMGPDIDSFAPKTGIRVRDLSDWHRVIDWWFQKYGTYAVAVKSQAAYSRDIDYRDVPAEKVDSTFRARVNGDPVEELASRDLEDHLFWYCVRKATEQDLPVKLHTGYYAGDNYMPLGRLGRNAASASDLCRAAPDTRFVFMHIDYPFYRDIIAVAKHYTNCYLDMCWAWIISPVGSVHFLKEYLLTAPSNKLVTFGGDYIPVEPVLGHAILARRGISLALSGLVEEDWISLDRALNLVEPLMRSNARQIFRLQEKSRWLRQAPWA